MIKYDPVMHMNQKLKGSLSLLLATLIWGSTFVAQSVGMDYIGPLPFRQCAALWQQSVFCL